MSITGSESERERRRKAKEEVWDEEASQEEEQEAPVHAGRRRTRPSSSSSSSSTRESKRRRAEEAEDADEDDPPMSAVRSWIASSGDTSSSSSSSSFPSSSSSSSSSFIPPSSSSSSSSSSAPVQGADEIDKLQRKIEEIEADLLALKTKISVIEQRRDGQPEGSAAWTRWDDEHKLHMQKEARLMDKEAGLRKELSQLRERAERAAALSASSSADVPSGSAPYDPGEWPAGTGHAGGAPFDLLASPSERVLLHPDILAPFGQTQRAELNRAAWLQISARQHFSMTTAVHTFLRHRISTMESEANDHHRNDSLVDVIELSSRIPLLRSRDVISASTSARTRPDAHFAVKNRPPYLLIEEKASDGQLNDARNDLITKFRWLKHYDGMPFVFAIAIAGNTIEFGQLDRQRTFKSFQVPNRVRRGRRIAQFCTSESDSIAGALDCIHGAINIGRYIRFLHENCPPDELGVAGFNRTIERPGDKTVRITFEHVIKCYKNISVADKIRMKEFYEETANVPCLEKGVVQAKRRRKAGGADGAEDDDDDDDDEDDEEPIRVTIHVTPVGVQRFPFSTDLAGIRRCAKDMLLALRGAHAAGWVIFDVREPNIILAHDDHSGTDRFFLIDACEFARRVGEPFPASFEKRPSKLRSMPKRARTDWDLLMLYDVFDGSSGFSEALDAVEGGRDFVDALARPGATAAKLLQHPFLRGVVP